MRKWLKSAFLTAAFAILGTKSWAGDVIVQNFGAGLNTQDSPASIDPTAAQDLLNVQFTPGGTAVFKRDGYASWLPLPISCSTCAVHGGYHFQQVGGNDVQLWGNDTELAGSVNDAAFVKLATATVSSTWQCADSQGFAYCLNSSRDTCLKTDGSSANTSFQSAVPKGTMLTFTPIQMVVAGVSGSENTLYISGQNNFLDFTVGTLPSSSFTEPIASPGSRITHIAYYFGKLFWWKDQSFGYATFTNQNDWQLTIVSNQVGTLDNSDAFWNASGFDSGAKFTGTAQANAERSPGGIFFRGQDNHLYVYDGFYLTRISRPISPTVTTASRKKANSWTQTNQADFASGGILPAGQISTSISPGDVTVSSFSRIENSSTQWTNGTTSNTIVGVSSITLTTDSTLAMSNPSFELGGALAPPQSWANQTSSSWQAVNSNSNYGCTVNPQAGSWLAFGQGFTNTGNTQILYATVEDLSGNVIGSQTVSIPYTGSNYCTTTWTLGTIAVPVSSLGKRVKVRFRVGKSDLSSFFYDMMTSSSYILGTNVTFYYNVKNGAAGLDTPQALIDNICSGGCFSDITAGSFTSQVYDTGFSSATYQLQSSWIANTSTPTFALFTSSAATGPWTTLATSTGTNRVGARYAMYSSTISISGTDSALTAISSVTIVASSSGTYYSAVNNAPSLTSWSTFGLDDSIVDASTITYYTRASTGSFSVLSSSPLWVAQSKNATVTASTGTYFQMRADFAITSATDTPKLNDFTFNWFEGSASDKSYMAYFNDAIWFGVSASSSVSTNNRVFYWDILNGAWSIFDIPSNGFLIENNALYFGDPVKGAVYKFGSVPTDNGASINSYWRSKAFLGGGQMDTEAPFAQNELISADFVLGESSTTMNYTYTLDSKTSTLFQFTAYDPAASLIQRNFLLPVGKIGKYYDFKLGDNSGNAPWRMMAHRMHYNKLNWKPMLN